jgi:urease accessory protein
MWRNILIAFWFLLIPSVALAHPGGHAGFLAGIAHPFSGADHVLAMVAVGLWAAMIGGRAIWAMPLTFIAAMVAGGVLGAAGIGFPAVEPMILASIVLLGVAAGLALRLPLPLALTGIALFGLAHGHAHGAEAGSADLWHYGAGFVAATLVLHLLGLGLGQGLIRAGQRRAAQGLGLAVAAAGVALAVAT